MTVALTGQVQFTYVRFLRNTEVLLTPELANDFHEAYDNVKKPSHEEQPDKSACEAENEEECEDFPLFDVAEHGPSLLQHSWVNDRGCKGFWHRSAGSSLTVDGRMG
jgi:hypothetical protein